MNTNSSHLPLTYHVHGSLELLELSPSMPDVVRILISARLAVPAHFSRTALSFFGEMLERGSTRHTKDAYEERLESLGAQVDIGADGELLRVHITTRAATLSDVLRVVRETLRTPLFLPVEIAHLQREFEQAFHEEEDDTRARAYAAFTRTLYAKHEVGYIPPVASRRKELKAISTKNLRALHAAFLTAPWVVSMAGDASSRAQVAGMVRSLHAGTLPLHAYPPAPVAAPAEKNLISVPGKQNIEFFIGNRLPLTLSHPDYLPFAFGLDVLGKRGGFSGRLMSTVREKEGLTYMIYAWTRGATVRACGHWNISTFFTPSDAGKGLASTAREITRLVQRGITDAELMRFKELLRNQFKLAHESTSSTLALYHTGVVAGRTIEDIASYPERVALLSKADVNRALKHYLDPQALVIVGAGPTNSIAEPTVE